MTHTYAILELSQHAFDEIATKMREAGYDHAFDVSDGKSVIDMHGIGVQAEDAKPAPTIEELEALLKENPANVRILPNGKVVLV